MEQAPAWTRHHQTAHYRGLWILRHFCSAYSWGRGAPTRRFLSQQGLSRQSVVANKAVTQTIGHTLRIVYYGLLINVDSQLVWWIFPLAIVASILGTRAGVAILARWHDVGFQRISRQIILTIATLCIIRGIFLLVPANVAQGL